MRLRENEAEQIADFLGMGVEDFVATYTVLGADRRSLTLTEREDGGCVLLSPDNLCTVHPVKPGQCRDFPEKWHVPGFKRKCQAASLPGKSLD